MAPLDIDDLSDHRLDPYREIRSRNWTQQSGLFIAEGPLPVERLLRSDYGVQSVLLDRKYFEHYAELVPAEVELLLVDHELVESVVGFHFHRGVLACGLRKPEKSLRSEFGARPDPAETLAAVVGVQDPENLGGILRSCAALGMQRVIIGPGTADPLSRRALRVSMGTALRLNLLRSRDMQTDLAWLQDEMQLEGVATSLEGGSQPLERATRSGAVLILVGNERYGLPADVQQIAKRKVRIDMELGTDSLNVCVAAGIVFHYFCRLAPGQPPT